MQLPLGFLVACLALTLLFLAHLVHVTANCLDLLFLASLLQPPIPGSHCLLLASPCGHLDHCLDFLLLALLLHHPDHCLQFYLLVADIYRWRHGQVIQPEEFLLFYQLLPQATHCLACLLLARLVHFPFSLLVASSALAPSEPLLALLVDCSSITPSIPLLGFLVACLALVACSSPLLHHPDHCLGFVLPAHLVLFLAQGLDFLFLASLLQPPTLCSDRFLLAHL